MLEAQRLPTDSAAVRTQVLGLSRSDVLVALLLAATLLLGGYFRFIGQNWDDYVHFHPDERFQAGNVITEIHDGRITFTDPDIEPIETQLSRCLARYPNTGGIGGYFDAQCSDWNPNNTNAGGFYAYGTLPRFTTRVVAETLVKLTDNLTHTDYNGIHLVWRSISATVDMLVILTVFFIGLHIHGKWTGLLSAFLYACCVFPIQQSHFATSDPMSSLFVALAVLFAVRVQLAGGKWWDYAAFGLSYGLGLACRMNLLPLVGLVVIAAGVQVFPALFGRVPRSERDRLLMRNFAGLVAAAALAFVAFRVANPHAFMGPGFFGLKINPRWTQDIDAARFGISGLADSPPNFQWVGRLNYIYPLNNMVLWGMGIALGLTGWLGWVWSGWRVLRGRAGATRNLLLFGWVLVYFGWLGGGWVTTMRYFLPLYPVLTVLAAWTLVELVQRAHESPVGRWRWQQRLSVGLMAGVSGFTLLWALMFTNIYHHMATFVQASQYVWEDVPGDFALRIDGSGTDIPLLNVAMWNNPIGNADAIPIQDYIFQTATRYDDGVPLSGTFTATASGTVSTIHAPHLGEILDDPDPEFLRFTVTRPGDNTPLATATLTTNLPRNENPVGNSYDIPFDTPLQVDAGQAYYLNVMASGGPLVGSGSIMALESGWEEGMPASVCTLPPDVTLDDDPPPGLLSQQECNARGAFNGLLNGYLLETHTEEDFVFTYGTEQTGYTAINKRDRMLVILDQTDYIMIPTNRRYDTQSRDSARWPMTNLFYDALFDGRLGFDLVATFQETFQLGPLRISDQYLPTYDAPEWLNEFEAEEAFSVYDHPVVFIFRKSDNYSAENARRLLNSVNLNRTDLITGAYMDPTIANLSVVPSIAADLAPTQLQMTEDMRETQYSGGTWSERFDVNSIINRNQVVAVIAWWLIIAAFGLAVWPIMFVLLPGLADRGYGMAKFIGIFLTGWTAWYLASLRIHAWSQLGVFLVLMAILSLSVVLTWFNRERLVDYLQRHWRRLVIMEGIAFVLYLFFIGVRLTNPDLWHQVYGGEKPMDFAYFNGVLRSTIFPPIDPWFAGGYLNYYYFGFVIVGTPTLLLGVVPSIAYNLILPTLFSMTGMAAFSAAFNITSALRSQAPTEEAAPEVEVSRPASHRPIGNPWVAGIAALLLVVVLGNLDTTRIFAQYVAQMGGYRIPQGMEWYLRTQYVEDFISTNGVEPNETAMLDINQHVADDLAADRFSDQLDYEVFKVTSLVEGLWDGTRALMRGDPLYVSPDRWFWGPSRVIAEIPVVSDNSINEMPYFTYLYGDLHAHMIAMPLTLFVVAFVFNEFILTGRDRRRRWTQVAALMLGAIAVGMSKATNTWDWPTLMLLSITGLCYSWVLKWEKFTRLSIIDLTTRLGVFVIMMVLAVLPYDYWFATAFTQLELWLGPNTPLWAYLDIHGLFVFLIICLLLWDTGRWLRSTKVRALRGRASLLLALLFAFCTVWLGAILVFLHGERTAILVIPVLAWVVVLFFRPGRSRPMQFVLVLTGMGLCISFGVEFVRLAVDLGRQNTLFKFYMQVWLFFSVVGGVAASWLIGSSIRWKSGLRASFFVFGGLLVFMAALYPVMATQGKAEFRMVPNLSETLDGMDYMRFANHYEGGVLDFFPLADDYNVIRWLQQNVQGSPVIIEAQAEGSLYKWGGRISIYTGLPSVIGWDHHQQQQRSVGPLPNLVRQREANVNAFYTVLDIQSAVQILRQYDVSYIIVSSYEHARYDITGGLEKFEQMETLGLIHTVYEEGQGTIYEVDKDALAEYGDVVLLTIEGGE